MYHYDIEVDILVNGRPVKKHSHDGKIFIESKHDTEYSLRIKNNSWVRRLVVVSVDGINVIDGEAAGSTKAGYVINGHSSTPIDGFRTSNDTVHPFKFSRKERSYAAKSDATGGDTTNCGVIGVEVYSEKEKPAPKVVHHHHHHDHWKYPEPWTTKPWYPTSPIITYGDYNAYGPVFGSTTSNTLGNKRGLNSSDLGTVTSSQNMMRSMSCGDSESITANLCALQSEEKTRGFDTGTEFVDREVESKVVDVDFEIGMLLVTISIYYATFSGLKSMGVQVVKQNTVSFPNPFPKGFCKPPRR